MSSGSLPLASYHRASHLGSGTYGSVVRAYNDDGMEVALKQFQCVSNTYDNDENDGEPSIAPIELGALREISCLRYLREDHAHVNVTSMIDVQPNWCDETDEYDSDYNDENPTNLTNRKQACLCMALPLYEGNSLQHAISKSYPFDRRTKVEIAHGILSAVAHLHDHHLLHRDIKPDNIMLESIAICNSSSSSWRPILIDFSLAKQSTAIVIQSAAISEGSGGGGSEAEVMQHTGGAGSATYTAPEVLAHELYGKPADLWSVGVVLLELLTGTPMPAIKEKHAFIWISSTLQSLPDLPFPHLIRSLLQVDAQKRSTARQALSHDLFVKKFGFSADNLLLNTADSGSYTPVNMSLALALPLEVDHLVVPQKRRKRVETIYRFLSENMGDSYNKENFASSSASTRSSPSRTIVAALEYAGALSQIDTSLDDPQSASLLHCVVLSWRFHEVHVLDLHDLDERETGLFAHWTLTDYVDEEATIFMLLDYCLYPRDILQLD